MTASELKELTDEELQQKLEDTRQELFDFRMQRAAVADAGGASETCHMKTEGIEVRRQTGAIQILYHCPGTWCQRCFDKGRNAKAFVNGVLCHQTGAYHDKRIRSVSTGCDGSNDQ